MAKLRRQGGAAAILRHRHLVGRAPSCHLVVGHDASREHASLHYSSRSWRVRDLASRNGTYVDGRRLGLGEECTLETGATLRFGTDGPTWELVDDAPPGAFACSAAGEWLESGPAGLAIPDPDTPLVVICRDFDGRWLAEGPEGAEPIGDLDTIVVAGTSWTVHLPEHLTSTVVSRQPVPVCELSLHFSVSQDEEHVRIVADAAGERLDLESRAHHYLLLTLARMRRQDAETGHRDEECGWIYQDDLAKRLGYTRQQVHLLIHRARTQLGSHQTIVEPARLIERRTTRQIRIGTSRLQVEAA
ncbi:MAG: FHA domain-containing protein [Myxococcales bacterium]|nr:FHA domain-containing protein [Myxococcales bacterium]